VVELPEAERRGLDLDDDEIHDLLPTALERRVATTPDDELLGEDEQDVDLDAPVLVYQTHFMG
jgi:hypothetical protein